MRRVNALFFALLMTCLNACDTKMDQPAEGTFGYDLKFLKAKDSVIVLKSNDGNGQVIVSPKYQAKVFTSTAGGAEGKSFGWINYKTFDAKALDPHMNAKRDHLLPQLLPSNVGFYGAFIRSNA